MTTRLSDAQLRALTLAARECGVTHGHDLLTRTTVAQVTTDSLRRAGLLADGGPTNALAVRWSGRRLIATAAGLDLLDTLTGDERAAALARWEAVKRDTERLATLGRRVHAACAAAGLHSYDRLSDAQRAARQTREDALRRLQAERDAVAAREAQLARLDVLDAELAALEAE
jgi:hypothetical protein